MPENTRLELLKTERPNPNLEAFIQFIVAKSGAPFGLSQQYSNSTVTGSDFRANQLFSQRTFSDMQKTLLEPILDWVLYRWGLWAHAKGEIKVHPSEFISDCDWLWPRMDELDELKTQQANAEKLQSMTASYRDVLGPDYKEKLLQIRDEIAWMKENGLAHPSYSMISGGERTGAELMPETV